MAFPGLQHVAITVSDLDASTQWYTRLFGADPVLDEDEEGGEFHHVVYALDGGLLFGLAEGWDWLQAARLGSVMGAIKIESQGPQNHVPDRATIARRFQQAYGASPWGSAASA